MCEREEGSFVDDHISMFIDNGLYAWQHYVRDLTVTVKYYQKDDEQMNNTKRFVVTGTTNYGNFLISVQ